MPPAPPTTGGPAVSPTGRKSLFQAGLGRMRFLRVSAGVDVGISPQRSACRAWGRVRSDGPQGFAENRGAARPRWGGKGLTSKSSDGSLQPAKPGAWFGDSPAGSAM